MASPFRDLAAAFAETRRIPRAAWLLIAAFVVDSMAYFGNLTLMSEYLSADVGWGDTYAGWGVSLFTMSATLFMLGAGSIAEGFGLRRAVIGALCLTIAGRLAYCLAPGHTFGVATTLVICSLIVISLGEAVLQPVCYSGVKQFTDPDTAKMGYAMIYAIMNAGIVAIGTLSAWIRPSVQDIKEGRASTDAVAGWFASFSGTGIQAVNWLCLGITALTLVGYLLFARRRDDASMVRPDIAPEPTDGRPRTAFQRLSGYFTEGPFSNSRFVFFIFMLLPVRTLFAHQWLTMPQYILRAYDKGVADRMEWLVNWTNPAIIFIGVPLAAALTRRMNVYTVMIIGSLVSAVPTFLLAGGPDLTRLITYLVVFSIGEALWSSRFLEYASELAPPGRVAQYMGLANVPWLLAKGTTGLYSGLLLAKYCPDGVPPEQLQTGRLWLIYACIAMLSPIGLWLARPWVMRGFASATPAPAAGEARG